MAMQLGHVHIKTRDDPHKRRTILHRQFRCRPETGKFRSRLPARPARPAAQRHGHQSRAARRIEHIAIETNDYAGALAKLKRNGAHILEKRFNNGRHVCWVAAPDGAQMELIEKV